MAAAAEPGTPKLNRSWRNTPPLISTAAAPCTEASKTLTRQATPISNKTPTIEPLAYQFQLSFKRFMSSGAHGYEESRACSPEESRSSTPTTSYFPSHASCNSLNSLSSLAASPTLGPADAPMPLTLSHSAAFGSELLLPAPLLRGRSATSMQLPLPYEEPMQYEELLPSPKPRLVREVLPCATPAQKLIVLPGSDPALPKSKLRRSHPIHVPLPRLDGPRSLTLTSFLRRLPPLSTVAPLTSGCADGLVLLSCTATLIQKVEAASISDAPWPKRVKYA